LHQDNPELDSPYFHPAFARAVAAVRPDASVGVQLDGEQPTAFFPFHRGPLGVGKPLALHFSDFQAVIAGRAAAWDPIELLRGCGLTGWEFDHLLLSQTAFTPFVANTPGSPYIDVSEGYAAYERRQKASSALISELGRKGRKMGREVAPLRFEFHRPDPALLRLLLDWKVRQYHDTKVKNVLAERWTTDLLERIMHAQEDGFGGALSALFAGDRPVALHVGMRSRAVLHYWFPAYDPAYGPYSTGQLLLLEMVKAAADQGVRRIDLGKGDATYKSRFMTDSTPLGEGYVPVSTPVKWLRGCLRGSAYVLRGGPLRWAVRRLRASRGNPAPR
jgi:CelD/BcsL family acetyltransferase involved in cellulose biosynthesis